MGDDLVVSTSGSSSRVASSELRDAAQHLVTVQHDLSALGARLTTIDSYVSTGGSGAGAAPPSAFAAEREIDLAVRLLGTAGNDCGAIAIGMRLAATAYDVAERAKQRAIETLAAQVGFAIGFLLPGVILTQAAPAAVGIGVFTIASGGPDEAVGSLQDWLLENNELITDPGFCALLRLAQKSIDDVIAGAVHLPPGIAFAVGDEGTDAVGDDLAAGLIVLGGGALGLFREGTVTVTTTGTTKVGAPATGFAERVGRIPKTDENGGSQIRIDKILHDDGHYSFEAYFSGTQDFSPSGTGTPFDMTSNMRMIGHLDAGSMEAAREALRRSGVGKDDPIVFVGHSQGALLAHELAASGDYSVTGVVEVGAPSSGNTLPDGANGVSIAHTDDIVTALGVDRPIDFNQIVVERQAFADTEIPKDEAVPAHNRDRYLETAALADESARGDLTRAREAMDAAGAHATEITSTTYKAVREVEDD